MATTRIPFSSGSPVKGVYFADRVQETASLVASMLSAQNIFLLSPRRYGKTSLLYRASELARKDGARVAYANLKWAASRQDVAEEITRAVIDGVAGRGKRRLDTAAAFMSHLPGAKLSLSGAGTDLDLDIALAAPAGGSRSFISEIKRPISEMARQAKGSPVCLVIDEFQQAAEIDSDLPGVFKGISDELTDVSLIFSGSRRHVIERLFRGAGAALKGVAQEMTIDVIPEPEMTSFLLERSKAGGRPMELASAHEIYRLVRGVPNAVQMLAKYAWISATARVDEEAVAAGLDALLRDQTGGFSMVVSQSSANERKLLRALAKGDWSRVFGQEFVQAVGISTPSIQYAIESLWKAEQVVRNERGEYRLEDPIFSLWLDREKALERG